MSGTRLTYQADFNPARQIAGELETAVADGSLPAGAKLPSIRDLAVERCHSPSTIAAAYRLLRARGVLVTGPKGTFVADRATHAELGTLPLPPDVRDLSDGNPDPHLLPDLDKALRGAFDRLNPTLYGGRPHLAELTELAVERFRLAEIGARRVTLVHGAFDGMERTFAAHLRLGDGVAVEDPGFPGVFNLARALGLSLVPMEIDDAGPTPESLAAALRSGARAVVITPRAQNPTGAALTANRVEQLTEVLARHPDVLLVEDHHADVISQAHRYTLASSGVRHWAAIHSIGKSLAPDLRIAFLAADHLTQSRVEERFRLSAGWVSHTLQHVVLHLWRDASTQRHLNQVATIYSERRDALTSALGVRGIPASGSSGWNVWIPVASESQIVRALHQSGWGVASGERFRLKSNAGIRVTTSTLAVGEADEFADVLAGALESRSSTRGV